jgi:hypothetical protein
MSKFILFDVDRSLASIGGDEGAARLAGNPPVKISGGIVQIQATLEKLFVKKVVKVPHPIFEEPYVTTVYEKSDLCVKENVEGIVIDTLSHAFRQDLRTLEAANSSKAMEMKDWGKLERMYGLFLETLKLLPVWAVVTCHSDYDKDQATGMFRYTPNLKGSTRGSVDDYFDVILYNKVDKAGKKEFSWQTSPDPSRFAKDRLNLLQPVMKPDLSTVIKTYRSSGHPFVKILIIGESGTGKTRSLVTLEPLNTKETT